MQISYFAAACFAWLLGCLALPVGKTVSHRLFAAFMLAGSVLCLVSAFSAWGHQVYWQAPEPVYFGVAPFLLSLDSLSAVFLALLGLIGAANALFSPGYLSHLDSRINGRFYWCFLFVFLASMAVVLAAANALTFLIFWEIMSISSAALVASDFANSKSQRACLIYVGATRLATAFLAAGFLWLHSMSGSWLFAQWSTVADQAIGPSILVLIGLCIKAGVWPFHIWLPYAHPAAPSPVSALMSGVMIKVAIYAIIRLFCLQSGSVFLATLLLALGIVSAIWGVLFALVQRDLKRLLAYSSIENIGIILIAIATCLLAQSSRLPLVAGLALTAALFHCLNHGMFKSLLFLCAGSIDCRAHTRDLGMLGGLGRYMPATALCCLIAGAAICALPPLNGFASKWLVYQGLFNLTMSMDSRVYGVLALASLGVLGLLGGLSLACFTKAIGVTFLGRPRTSSVTKATEVTWPMVASQGILAAGCVVLGVLSPFIANELALTGSKVAIAEILPPALNALPWIAVLVPGIAAALYFFVLTPAAGRKTYQTWECGFGPLTSRMQTTADSFVHPELRIFHSLFQYKFDAEISGRDKRHFPERITAEAEMTSLLETRVYGPVVGAVRSASSHLAKLQAGSIHLYLLYVLTTLIILLIVGVKL